MRNRSARNKSAILPRMYSQWFQQLWHTKHDYILYLPRLDAIIFLNPECYLHKSTAAIFSRRLYSDESTIALLIRDEPTFVIESFAIFQLIAAY